MAAAPMVLRVVVVLVVVAVLKQTAVQAGNGPVAIVWQE